MLSVYRFCCQRLPNVACARDEYPTEVLPQALEVDIQIPERAAQ
jgi:hypothetical protein